MNYLDVPLQLKKKMKKKKKKKALVWLSNKTAISARWLPSTPDVKTSISMSLKLGLPPSPKVMGINSERISTASTKTPRYWLLLTS